MPTAMMLEPLCSVSAVVSRVAPAESPSGSSAARPDVSSSTSAPPLAVAPPATLRTTATIVSIAAVAKKPRG